MKKPLEPPKKKPKTPKKKQKNGKKNGNEKNNKNPTSRPVTQLVGRHIAQATPFANLNKQVLELGVPQVFFFFSREGGGEMCSFGVFLGGSSVFFIGFNVV